MANVKAWHVAGQKLRDGRPLPKDGLAMDMLLPQARIYERMCRRLREKHEAAAEFHAREAFMELARVYGRKQAEKLWREIPEEDRTDG